MPDLNLADAYDAIAATIPDADAIIHGKRRRSWAEYEVNADRIARSLTADGVGPGAKVGFFMRNSIEYLEAQYGCFKAGAIPCNINFRYTTDELSYLLDNADAQAVFFDADLAEPLVEAVESMTAPKLCIQVSQASAQTPPSGVVPYGEFLNSANNGELVGKRSGDDLWFLYTGGTTGMPKAVMWEHSGLVGITEVYFNGLKLPVPTTAAQAADAVTRIHDWGKVIRLGVAAPLIHGTANFGAQAIHLQGGAVVLTESRSFDAAEQLRAVEEERITNLIIVGDVFSRPLVDELRAAKEEGRPYDLRSVRVVQSSGVMWSGPMKAALREFFEHAVFVDALGSSEGVNMASEVTKSGTPNKTARFELSGTTQVFNEAGKPVEPGSGERGLLAVGPPLPLGYYKDPEKTAATYPIINGKRWAMAGDWATVETDGSITLLGRGSGCINTGGEKVYPEEVEEVLKLHRAVEDANVVGVDDPTWGQRVVAVVGLADNEAPAPSELIDHVKGHLAAYKAPKQIVYADPFVRNPNGKSDYRWAKNFAEAALRASES